jgi:hypothetical protein
MTVCVRRWLAFPIIALFGATAGAQAPSNPIGKEEMKEIEFSIKEQIDLEKNRGLLAGKSFIGGESATRMQRYAETKCQGGNKTACVYAYCGPGQGDYYSRKCAGHMGRDYGDNWMEMHAERPRPREDGHEIVMVACMNDTNPASIRFASPQPRIECLKSGACRHTNGASSKATRSAYFGALSEAAAAACTPRGTQR